MIRHALLAVIMNALVLWGITQILPDYILIKGGVVAFLVSGLFLGLLNTLIKPLLKLIALPLIVLTAGLFSIVINAFLLFVLEYASNIFTIGGMSFDIQGGFIAYAIVSFVLTVMNEVAHWLIK
ncbi:phage holin family protein [Candidatus Peregrinibacteria bacterium]|jgi:putative membrane protein|nr:phage holin family protein [Candidatus Peregrinibacteria bacterium]